MSCEHSTELTAYLQGEGSPGERERLGRHVGACGSCAQELAQLKRTLGALDGLDWIEPSPGFGSRVEQAFLRAHPQFSRRPKPPLLRLLPAAGIAAGVLLAVAGAVALGRPWSGSADHPKMGHLAPEPAPAVTPPTGSAPAVDPPSGEPASAWDAARAYDRELLAGVRAAGAGDPPAVARAVRWLVDQQGPEGDWKGITAGDTIERTGLALLAIGGYPEAALATRKGIAFLRSRQRDSGALGGGSPDSHAIATLAMLEAGLRTGDPSILRAASRAVALVSEENRSGPWVRGAVTGWQYQALRLAAAAGDRSFLGLLDRGREMTLGAPSSEALPPAARAAWLFVGLLVDPEPRPTWWRGRTAWVLDHSGLPGTEPTHFAQNDLRFAYFATALLSPLGGDPWTKWWSPLREKLSRTQSADGAWPDGFEEGRDRLYVTALSALILEAPRRLPPLPE